MTDLTNKQEEFAQEIVKGSTQADAYRAAYDAANMKDETVWSNASRLIDNSKVAARIKELRQPSIDKVQLTLESHLTDLLKLRNMAAKDEKWSAAIQAETIRGKAAGLHIDKMDVKQELGELKISVIELVSGDDKS
jgi:phage terminase small subunit|tara:strand:+ start:1243 stop:1650 length:408 start_codon:yes stop_codon:yes gene_type:complete